MTALLVAIVVLQGLDLLTTLAFLKRGVRELNPTVRTLQDEFGPFVGTLIAKGIFAALVLGLYAAFTLPLWALVAVAGLYVVVVANNVYWIVRSR